MRIRDSILALGLLAFAMAPAGLAQSQRCDDYLERNPNADAQLVHFIDQVFPGDALLKVSVPDFVMLWHAAPFYREGAPHQRAVRLFRSFQNAALELRTLPRAWEKFTRPTTAHGPFAYTPPVNPGDAVILEQEPNDTIAQANPFTCGDTVEGEISPALEDDIFELVLAGATALQARVDPGTSGSPIGDARLEILDPAGNSIAFNDDFNGLMPQINILLLPGTYYFLVDGFSSNTGTYVFSPNCAAVTTLDCSNSSGSGTIVAPDQSDVYLLNLASPDTVVLEVVPRSAGFRSELSVTSGGTLLALTDRGGFLPGSARISLGLAAGSVLLTVGGKDDESLGSYDIIVSCTGAGLPGLACGASGTFQVSQDSSPLIDLGVPGAQEILLDIDDLALYDSTEAAVEDSTGTVYFDSGTAAKPAPGTYSLSSLASIGSRLRLIADPVSLIGGALRTWNGNTTYPQNWDNPGTTYAGPTDVTLSAGGFPFSDEHVNSAGMMVLRKYEYFDCQGGGWDVGTYIDESYIEVDLGAGPQRVYPSRAVMQTGDGVDWAVKRIIGTMADVSADDGSYLAFNLADTRRASDDWFTIDLYFDVRSLGFTGSQIQSLRFYAEWYFGGNPSGSTTSPPSGADESEEYNIYLDRLELARRTGHWDFVADILDPFQYTPPPLPQKSPAVDVTLTCTPFASTTTMSPEDVAPGNITAAAPFTAFTQAVGDIGRSIDVTATAAQANVGGLDPQVWAFAADGTFLGTDDDSGGGFDSEITVSIEPNTAVTFVVGASAAASVGRTEGLLDFGIAGPFGYAGDAPFTVGLGSTFTWRTRGTPGDFPIGLITMFPNLPLGIGFSPPFDGKLIADVSALINLDPNGGIPLPSSGLYESATIPVPSDPLLAGARIDGQLIVLDAALTTFTFFNGDHIVLQ